MRERRSWAALATAVVILVGGTFVAETVEAFAFRIPGYTGPVTIKLEDFTDSTLYAPGTSCSGTAACDAAAASSPLSPIAVAAGEDSWAIFKISSILTFPGAATLWADGDAGEELTGILYGIRDDFVSIPVGGLGEIDSIATASGLKFDVYLDDSPDFDPSGGPLARTGITTYPTATDGTLFLSGTLVPGAHTAGTGGGADTLLHETVFLASPFLGTGSGFADVTGGAFGPKFDTDGVPTALGTLVDFKLNFDADGEPGGSPPPFDWTTVSDDPIRGNVVPQPASLVLLGLALMGLASTAYRRRKQ